MSFGHHREHLSFPCGVSSSSGSSERRRASIAADASGSSTEPPSATRRTESMNLSMSANSILHFYSTPAAFSANSSAAYPSSTYCESTSTAVRGSSDLIIERGPQTLVGMGRRHLDVDDRDIGLAAPPPCAAGRRDPRPGQPLHLWRLRAGGRFPPAAAANPQRELHASRESRELKPAKTSPARVLEARVVIQGVKAERHLLRSAAPLACKQYWLTARPACSAPNANTPEHHTDMTPSGWNLVADVPQTPSQRRYRRAT